MEFWNPLLNNRVFRCDLGSDWSQPGRCWIWFLEGPEYILFTEDRFDSYFWEAHREQFEEHPDKVEIPIKSLLTFGNPKVRKKAKEFLDINPDPENKRNSKP